VDRDCWKFLRVNKEREREISFYWMWVWGGIFLLVDVAFGGLGHQVGLSGPMKSENYGCWHQWVHPDCWWKEWTVWIDLISFSGWASLVIGGRRQLWGKNGGMCSFGLWHVDQEIWVQPNPISIRFGYSFKIRLK
jgi:hypothetical protein